MAVYTLPDLAGIDPAELVDFLADRGIACVVYDQTGLTVATDSDADAALAAFAPTSTFHRPLFSSDYVGRIPSGAAVATHLQHIKDFRTAIRSGASPAPSLAQTQHVLADVIDGLRLLDPRLNRDT
jgi:hypothetical protein